MFVDDNTVFGSLNINLNLKFLYKLKGSVMIY